MCLKLLLRVLYVGIHSIFYTPINVYSNILISDQHTYRVFRCYASAEKITFTPILVCPTRTLLPAHFYIYNDISPRHITFPYTTSPHIIFSPKLSLVRTYVQLLAISTFTPVYKATLTRRYTVPHSSSQPSHIHANTMPPFSAMAAALTPKNKEKLRVRAVGGTRTYVICSLANNTPMRRRYSARL